MSQVNIALSTIEWLEMDPHGVVTGAIGAMMSLFVLNGNTFTWKKTVFILFTGTFICGYSMIWIESKFIKEGDSRALAHLINLLVGFLSSDLMSSIKSAAPTLTNLIVTKGLNYITKFVPSPKTPSDDVDDK